MKKHGQKWVALLLSLLLLTGSVSVLAAKEETPTNTEEKVVKKKEVHVPILLYHHVTDEAFNGNDISMISPFDFRMHMMAIKEHFTPISLRDYYEYVTATDEKATIPDNPIIITFDDGYLSNYEIAYPILKEFKIPATIFVVTDTVGEEAGGGKVNYSHFTWQQAKEMERSGLIEIQSHTANHTALSTLSVHDLVLELRKSKYDIEKNLNRECDMIAFPYGSYNQEVLDAAERAGYKLRALVDDKTSADDFEVNLVSGGVGALTRMTVSGNMGNVDLIENIKKACKRKPLSIW